jgi:hypothetical protein
MRKLRGATSARMVPDTRPLSRWLRSDNDRYRYLYEQAPSYEEAEVVAEVARGRLIAEVADPDFTTRGMYRGYIAGPRTRR